MKVLGYGKTGTGKTYWGAAAPRPLILLREEQGLATIVERNPDATVIVIESWQDFVDVYSLVKTAEVTTASNGQPACHITLNGESIYFQSLVVDSFTDMQKLMVAHVKGVDSNELEGEGDISIKQWGRIINVTEHVLQDQRAIPCNTVFICLAEMAQDDLNRVMMAPALYGKRLPAEMGQFFNAVGYFTKNANGEFVVVWNGDDRFITKPPHGWPDLTENSREPGRVSLGSLMLATQQSDIAVAHEEHDSAEFIRTNETQNQETEDV